MNGDVPKKIKQPEAANSNTPKILDPDWQKLREQPFLHADTQTVMEVDDQHLAIGFFDPFLEHFNGKGITCVMTKENALALVSEILSKVEK